MIQCNILYVCMYVCIKSRSIRVLVRLELDDLVNGLKSDDKYALYVVYMYVCMYVCMYAYALYPGKASFLRESRLFRSSKARDPMDTISLGTIYTYVFVLMSTTDRKEIGYQRTNPLKVTFLRRV